MIGTTGLLPREVRIGSLNRSSSQPSGLVNEGFVVEVSRVCGHVLSYQTQLNDPHDHRL